MRLAAWKDEGVREHDTLFGPPDSQVYDKSREGDGFWPCLCSVEKQMVQDNDIHSWKNVSMLLDNTRLIGAQVRSNDPTNLGSVQPCPILLLYVDANKVLTVQSRLMDNSDWR